MGNIYSSDTHIEDDYQNIHKEENYRKWIIFYEKIRVNNHSVFENEMFVKEDASENEMFVKEDASENEMFVKEDASENEMFVKDDASENEMFVKDDELQEQKDDELQEQKDKNNVCKLSIQFRLKIRDTCFNFVEEFGIIPIQFIIYILFLIFLKLFVLQEISDFELCFNDENNIFW